jgi:hypothetical protein
VLNAFVIPILIQQYPDFFESNPAALPLAVIATLLLLLPLACHHSWKIFGLINGRIGSKHPSMAWISVIAIGALIGGASAGGGYWLYLRHTAHVIEVAAKHLHVESNQEPDRTGAVSAAGAVGSHGHNLHRPSGRTEGGTPLRTTKSTPSLDVIFDPAPGREAFNLFNRGHTNLYLWGTKLDGGPRTLDAPRLITPGGTYHIWAQPNAAQMRQKLGANGEARVNLELYVSLEDKSKYVLTYQLWMRTVGGVLTVETQNLGFKNEDFTR